MWKKAKKAKDGWCTSTTYWEMGEAEICKMPDSMESITRKKCSQTTKNTRPSNAD